MPLENYIYWLLPSIGVLIGWPLLVHTYVRTTGSTVEIHLTEIVGVLIISFVPIANFVATIIIFMAIFVFWIKHLSKKGPIFTVKYKPTSEDTFDAIKNTSKGNSNHGPI